MKKNKLDFVFKSVIVGVLIVFIYSRVSIMKSTINEVYGQQIEQNNLLLNDSNYDVDKLIEGKLDNGIQVIEFDLQSYSYPTLNVQANKPVKLIINADEKSLNSCNYRIISQDFGIQCELGIGENIIEFTPTKTGAYVYNCWMGMIGANINVTDKEDVPSAYYDTNISQGNCCSN